MTRTVPAGPSSGRTAADYDIETFYEGLVRHGLIVPVGVPGAFGRGAVFEDVLERFNALVSRVAEGDGAEVYTFPPVISRNVLQCTEYLDSFPQLCGTVHSFFGKERDALELSRRVHAGEDWSNLQHMTDLVLNPAACYPIYPSFTGTVPADGRLVTMLHWVFRHEPSREPTRMQSFRVREFVRVGTPEQVLAWRDMWLQRGLDILLSIGLPAQAEVASDPFFGRGGKMLAQNQIDQKLKFEIVVPVISLAEPTACCSFNLHRDHFGNAFSIRTPDGEVANTACLGFGLERIVMALFKAHGFDPRDWPAAVRESLWP
jgi:seryl-tRNA synthetase